MAEAEAEAVLGVVAAEAGKEARSGSDLPPLDLLTFTQSGDHFDVDAVG